MKKQTINSFSEGINYDLQPLATPANVLTDCLNGTFITFNGDELALQNDAGNTSIDTIYPTATEYVASNVYNNGEIVYVTTNNIPTYYKNISGVNGDDSDISDSGSWYEMPLSKVTLSNGFTPIGIKEYGGVLYIISKKITYPNEALVHVFESGEIHSLNHYYTITINTITYYYKCIDDSGTNADTSLPIESNAYWEYIGTLADYNNYLAEIEIGSYPSPEFGGNVNNTGIEVIYLNTGDNETSSTHPQNRFYKSTPLSLVNFQSGDRVTFNTPVTTDLSYVSYYNSDQYVPKFYNIKLLQQLENGSIDLTSDVWSKYRAFKQADGDDLDSTTFWFNSESEGFNYYCPNRYKGILNTYLDIEDLQEFKTSSKPLVESDGNNYTITFNISAVGRGSLDVTSVLLEIPELNISQTEVVVNNVSTVVVNIDASQKLSILPYTCTPIIEVDSVDITSELPQKYIDKYTIKGNILITTDRDLVYFEPVVSNYDCELATKYFNEIALVNVGGDYIDLNLDVTIYPRVFIKENTSPTLTDAIQIGTYKFENNTLIIVSGCELDYINDALEDLDISTVTEASTDCPSTYEFIVHPVILEKTADGRDDYQSYLFPLDTVYYTDMDGTKHYGSYVPDTAGYIKFAVYGVKNVNDAANNYFSIYVTNPLYSSKTYTGVYYLSFDFQDTGSGLTTTTNSVWYIPPSTQVISETATSWNETAIPIIRPILQKVEQTVTINTSTEISSDNLQVYQGTTAIPLVAINNKKYIFTKGGITSVRIVLTQAGFDDIDLSLTIPTNNTINIGLVAKLEAKLEEDALKLPDGSITPARIIYVAWRPDTKYVGSAVVLGYTITQGSPTGAPLVWGSLYDISGFEQVIDYPLYSLEVTQFEPANLITLDNNVYTNLPTGTNYVTKAFGDDIVIFKKIYPVNLE